MPRSVVAAVLERAGSHPDAVAVIEADREISYAALAGDVEAAARGLQAQGVAAGDTIALDQDAGAEDGYAGACRLYALLYLGAAVLPLGTELLPERRQQLLREFGARRLDAPPQAHAPAARRADDAERPSVYRFSTGSTGAPKAAVVSNEKWAAMYVAQARALGLDASDRVLPAMPLPSTMGLRSLVRAHAVGGAIVNLPFPADLPALAQAVARHGVTRLAASPAQLRLLLARPAPPDLRLPALRGVITGGAPLLPAEQEAVRRRIAPLYIDYGAVDFSMIAVQAPGEALRLVEGIEAEVVDAIDRALPEGAEGFLRVRAAWAPTGHIGGAASPHYRGGWFYPGDLAALLPGRGLRLLGRADDLINRSGIKILPEEIEAVLRAHPEVADAAVAGVPDAISGEVPVAFVVLRRLEALQELDGWCRGRIEAIRFPAKFVALSAIPRSAEGKVLRAQLRALARGR